MAEFGYDELIAEKEPPAKRAGDHDPSLAARSHPFTFEGEIEMWGELAEGANSPNRIKKRRLAKWTLFSIFLGPAAVILFASIIEAIQKWF